MIANLTACS